MAATLHHMGSGARHLLHPGKKRAASIPAEPFNREKEEKEKRFVSQYEDNKRPLSPNSIAKDPRNKELGCASRQLKVNDFELVKTLGTGESIHIMYPKTRLIVVPTGTFARVWLVKLKDAEQQDKDKVYALKILRKVDSEPHCR